MLTTLLLTENCNSTVYHYGLESSTLTHLEALIQVGCCATDYYYLN